MILLENKVLTQLNIIIKKNNLHSFFDNFYHLSIALLPVLYIISVPGLGISMGTIIIIGFVPYSLIYILKWFCQKNRVKAYPFFIFYLYLIFRADGNVTRIILCIAAFIIIFGQMKGAINNSKIRKIIESFAVVNVILLVIQVISYYVLHFRIQYIPKGLIYEEYQNAYVFREFSGLYRPSALFLEPSHFSQYCIFALISVLFPEEGKQVNIKKAFAIGLGCILTTSGMGIGLTAGVFAWYIVLNRQSLQNKVISLFWIIPVLAITMFILFRTAFFQVALQRVFSSVEGYNAISGRVHNWDDAIGSMHGSLLWFGYGDSKMYRFYLTGLADTIYKYGVLCVVLESLCFLYLMLKKVNNFIWCCSIVFIILFCVAHITNFVSQVFYFGILIADAGSFIKDIHGQLGEKYYREQIEKRDFMV